MRIANLNWNFLCFHVGFWGFDIMSRHFLVFLHAILMSMVLIDGPVLISQIIST